MADDGFCAHNSHINAGQVSVSPRTQVNGSE